MSWSKSYLGTPPAIITKLATIDESQSSSIPRGIRESAIAALQLLPNEKPVLFETNGHIDATNGYFRLEVKGISAEVL